MVFSYELHEPASHKDQNMKKCQQYIEVQGEDLPDLPRYTKRNVCISTQLIRFHRRFYSQLLQWKTQLNIPFAIKFAPINYVDVRVHVLSRT